MKINAIEIISIIGERTASALEIINTELLQALGVKLFFFNFRIINLARSKIVVLNGV